ncbi:restriction endonuclease subunit S [Staphylococcus epidermidis]|nr:restriction endonuclease subunit S [Staphylococcus schleiferi]
MTEQVNTPELRFPEFTEKLILQKLNSVASVTMGQSPKSSNYTDDFKQMTLVQGNADLKNGKINSRIYTTEITKIAKVQDIILTVRAPVGELAIAQKEVCIGRGVCAIKANKFVYYFLEKLKINKLWTRLSQGSTFEAISGNDIKNINVTLPSKKEQTKIGNFFSKLDQQIELEEKKLELLEQQKKGYMQKIFSQELRFKDENGNEYPEWEEKTIKDVYKVTRGYVLARKLMSDNPNSINKYPVYSSQTSNNGLMGYYSDYLYQDAITWTTDGANAGSVSFRHGKFYCTNVCGVLLNELGNSNVCMAEMLNNIAFKYVSKVGNPKLMNNVMAMIKLKFPCLEEQQAISKFLNVFSEVIDNQNKKVELLKERKKGLLQKMFV